MISCKFLRPFFNDLFQLVGKSRANQISAAVFVKITNEGNMEPDRHQFVRENISEQHYFQISLKKALQIQHSSLCTVMRGSIESLI